MGCFSGSFFSRRQGVRFGDQGGVDSGSRCRYAALLASLAVVVMLCATPLASAAAPATGTAAPPQTPNAQALAWIDHFATVQVLFSTKDIARIRKKIAAAPPEKAQQWLDETAAIRRKLDSPEWQRTRTWLGEFLKVQAIYSDKDLEEFRKKAMTANPAEIAKMMQQIEQRRTTLANKASDSARRRQQTMEVNQAFQQEQAAQRAAARRAASQGATSGGAKAGGVTGKPSYAERSAARAPLVNSLDAARWGVYRSIWPRW